MTDGSRWIRVPVAATGTTTARRAEQPAATAPASQGAVAPGDQLRLREVERGVFLLESAGEAVGKVRFGLKGILRLTVGGREFTIKPDGRGHGVMLVAADETVVARFVDRRFRGDQLLTGDRTLTFEGKDEHLADDGGARLASFTPRAGATRVVLVDVLAEEAIEVLAFAAVIVVLRRLPANPAKRFGLSGGRAPGRADLWIADAVSGGGGDGGGGAATEAAARDDGPGT
jgi:hypothetical protein